MHHRKKETMKHRESDSEKTGSHEAEVCFNRMKKRKKLKTHEGFFLLVVALCSCCLSNGAVVAMAIGRLVVVIWSPL